MFEQNKYEVAKSYFIKKYENNPEKLKLLIRFQELQDKTNSIIAKVEDIMPEYEYYKKNFMLEEAKKTEIQLEDLKSQILEYRDEYYSLMKQLNPM